jgi:lysophospholipase L1-like esterase
MQHLKTIILTATIALAASIASARDFQDWSQLNRYHDSNLEVRLLPANQRCVVFLGNSITDNWAKMRPEFFAGNGFIGRGISGQTTYQFVSRFREDVINLHPQIVVINAATNDVAENTHPYNEDITVGNITTLIELAQANGITPILTTTLPAASFKWRPEITDSSAKILSLNNRLRALAGERGIPFVDYYSYLVTPDANATTQGTTNSTVLALNPAYTNDGVHPTDAGYEVMESIILPVIHTTLSTINSPTR